MIDFSCLIGKRVRVLVHHDGFDRSFIYHGEILEVDLALGLLTFNDSKNGSMIIRLENIERIEKI